MQIMSLSSFTPALAINVGNTIAFGVLALEDGKLGGVAKLFEGAARGVVGEDDGLVGVEDFRGFRHEVYARERYDVGVGFLRLARGVRASRPHSRLSAGFRRTHSCAPELRRCAFL